LVLFLSELWFLFTFSSQATLRRRADKKCIIQVMKIKRLSDYLQRLEDTPSRIEITKILAELFTEAEAGEIDKITYLILGSLAPRYEGLVFNIAEKMMLRVFVKAYGKELQEIKDLYNLRGDMGLVASELAQHKGDGFDVADVYGVLKEIAIDEGEGSQERKVDDMALLLKHLDPSSAKFVARIPVGKLRLGFSDKTIIDALSWMEAGNKSLRSKIESAYQVLPDVGLLAREVKLKGAVDAAKSIDPVVGIPVLGMLAQRLKSPAEMIAKMKKVAVEPKLDGLRIQLHYKKGQTVKAYTRNLNETSWMFPELEKMGDFIKAEEVILDTEAVGVDAERKAMANFQATMTRRRKHDIEKIAEKVGINFYVFDILAKDGKGLMQLNYEERRKVLEQTLIGGGLFKMIEYHLTQDPKEIARLNLEYRKRGYEGIMIKRYDSAYVPGRTGWRWVKMKEAEEALGKLADTVDCVVMGYTAGRGKRVSFGVGQFLVGVKDGEKIKTVTKVGTGLTDEQFRELKTRLKNLEVPQKPKVYEVNKLLEPDFWVNPEVVVEIAADEITKSPTHTAGLALRFPRLVRFRDDKSPEQATKVGEVEKLFNLQNS
jgi:DNA ligase 1